MKQDNGARVFAVIAIILFACYFIGALTVHAHENSPLPKYGTAHPAVRGLAPSAVTECTAPCCGERFHC